MEALGNTVTKENVVGKSEHVLGVELLRCYMAFMVVLAHFGGNTLFPAEGILCIFGGFHVPVFMFLSFLLCGKYFFYPTKEGVSKRLVRILVPLLFWGVAAFLCVSIKNLVMGQSFADSIPLRALCWQLLTGHSGMNSPLWYLAVTLWISVLFWMLGVLFEKKVFLLLISVLAVISVVSQYVGLNYALFGSLPYELKYPLGRMTEMIPYASLGVLCSMALPKLNKLNFKQHLIIFIVAIGLIAVVMLIKHFFIHYTIEGFGYNGIYSIIISLLLTVSAFTVPLNYVRNKVFVKVVRKMTDYTMGVFCMHILVGGLTEYVFLQLGFQTRTILMCLAIYVVSYIISLLISLIPLKQTDYLVR